MEELRVCVFHRHSSFSGKTNDSLYSPSFSLMPGCLPSRCWVCATQVVSVIPKKSRGEPCSLFVCGGSCQGQTSVISSSFPSDLHKNANTQGCGMSISQRRPAFPGQSRGNCGCERFCKRVDGEAAPSHRHDRDGHSHPLPALRV